MSARTLAVLLPRVSRQISGRVKEKPDKIDQKNGSLTDLRGVR